MPRRGLGGGDVGEARDQDRDQPREVERAGLRAAALIPSAYTLDTLPASRKICARLGPMMTRRQCVAALGGAAIPRAAASPLVAEWRAIAAKTDGVVGAAALRLDSGDLVSLRGDERFPLASVCKLPIEMAILAMVADAT